MKIIKIISYSLPLWIVCIFLFKEHPDVVRKFLVMCFVCIIAFVITQIAKSAEQEKERLRIKKQSEDLARLRGEHIPTRTEKIKGFIQIVTSFAVLVVAVAAFSIFSLAISTVIYTVIGIIAVVFFVGIIAESFRK